MGLTPSLKADLSLLGISAVWGSTFVVVKRALDDCTPSLFLVLRFVVAAAALGLLFRRQIAPPRAGAIRAGAVLGLFLCLGFLFQTLGLLYTTPSRSAFVTGLYVIGVPLLAAALRLRGLTTTSVAGAALALAGLWLMTASGAGPGSGFGRGEALTALCAVAFASHIVGVDIATRRHEKLSVAFWQVAVAGALCVPLALLTETPRVRWTPFLIAAVLITGLGGTALAFAVQNAVQARTTPTRAAIIFTSEPVFAAATSFIVSGERLGGRAAAGAALIVTGMLASEIQPPRTPEPRS